MTDTSAKRTASAGKPNGDSSNSVTELVLTCQRKNVEGILRASQVALDGAVAVWRQQLDFAEGAARRYARLADDLEQKQGSPSEQLASCVEHFKQDFEQNLLNARALLELSSKASRQSMQIIGERLDQSLGEVARAGDARNS